MSQISHKIRNLRAEDGLIYQSTAAALTIPTGRRIVAIFAHEASVVNVTIVKNSGSDGTTAVAIPVGATWPATCSACTLVSGKITAYLDDKLLN